MPIVPVLFLNKRCLLGFKSLSVNFSTIQRSAQQKKKSAPNRFQLYTLYIIENIYSEENEQRHRIASMQINKSSNTFPFAEEINHFLYSILCLNFVYAITHISSDMACMLYFGVWVLSVCYVLCIIQIELSVVERIFRHQSQDDYKTTAGLIWQNKWIHFFLLFSHRTHAFAIFDIQYIPYKQSIQSKHYISFRK